MKPDHFAYHLAKYFADYLPNQIAASKNTIHSYRDTFVQLFEFYKETQHIPPEKLDYACFTAPWIEEFLSWLEETREIGASTRNQRLAAIHAFFKYLQYRDPSGFVGYPWMNLQNEKELIFGHTVCLTLKAFTMRYHAGVMQ